MKYPDEQLIQATAAFEDWWFNEGALDASLEYVHVDQAKEIFINGFLMGQGDR